MNLTPSPVLQDVPQIEVTTLLLGGSGGPLNEQAQALLNREAYFNKSGAVVLSSQGLVLDGTTDVSAALSAVIGMQSATSLVFDGVAHVASPTTITLPIEDTTKQIFSETSQVTIDNGLPVRPEWFGMTVGAIRRAIKALPATGGIVDLRAVTYPHNNWRYGLTGPGEYIDKPVWLRGSRMPTISTNCQRTENGTIIQGMVLSYADNVSFSNLGVDSGLDVCNTFFSGAAQEGLLRTYPDEATKAAAPLKQGGFSHNVIALARDPSAQVHAMILAEGVTGVRITGASIAVYGTHGQVGKASDLNFDTLHSYMNGGEGVILKSDGPATSRSVGVTGNSVKSFASGPTGSVPHAVATTGVGFMLNPEGGSIDTVQIGSVWDDGHPVGVSFSIRPGFSVVGLQIGQIRSSSNSVAAVDLSVSGSETFNYSHIGSVIATNTPIAVRSTASTGGSVVVIDAIQAKNCDVAAQFSGSVALVVGDIVADNCTSGAIRYLDDARCKIRSVTTLNTLMFAADGLTPTLLNGWGPAPGGDNEQFGLDFVAGGIHLRGTVSGGTSNFVGKLPVFARPQKVQRFTCTGMASGTTTDVLVTVSIEGDVVVNEYNGAGVANVAGWLTLDCFWRL